MAWDVGENECGGCIKSSVGGAWGHYTTMSEKIPFYRYPYAASVATAEDPDYEPPEEEEAEDPDSSLEAEGVQDVAVGSAIGWTALQGWSWTCWSCSSKLVRQCGTCGQQCRRWRRYWEGQMGVRGCLLGVLRRESCRRWTG